MRYREGQDPSGELGGAGSDEVMVFTYAIGLIIGIILTWVGWRGRQWWLVFWCGGLIIASIAVLIWDYV
ncbi:MAG: hypothetical protein GKR94_10460 [Gammaproteobacteria bacterium]|nr:hypothetical protein [Gammaproteobacteria bacterium]